MLAIAAALAAASAGLAAPPGATRFGSPLRTAGIDRGIVQSVSGDALVLKALDGTTVTIAVDSSTRVLVNGQPATLADVRPGAVAAATHPGRGPARVIRVFDSSQQAVPVVDRGVVRAVSASLILLRRADGTTLAIAVGPSTRVLVNGQPATIASVGRGMTAAVRHAGSHPALAIRARGRKTR
jgi:hypothetical protein